jgi:urea transport system permease protein
VVAAVTRSKLGALMVAVRDAEGRTRFLGWRAEHVKLFAFTLSAMMAGVAGALYVPQVGIVNPGEFAPLNSIEVVVWTAVGGRATILGPVIGAVLVNGGKSYFTAAAPDAWLFILGGLFVFVTLFLPRGIVGTFDHGWRELKDRRRAARAEKGVDTGLGDTAANPAE